MSKKRGKGKWRSPIFKGFLNLNYVSVAEEKLRTFQTAVFIFHYPKIIPSGHPDAKPLISQHAHTDIVGVIADPLQKAQGFREDDIGFGMTLS